MVVVGSMVKEAKVARRRRKARVQEEEKGKRRKLCVLSGETLGNAQKAPTAHTRILITKVGRKVRAGKESVRVKEVVRRKLHASSTHQGHASTGTSANSPTMLLRPAETLRPPLRTRRKRNARRKHPERPQYSHHSSHQL